MRVIGLDQSYTGFGYCTDGKSIKKSFATSTFPNPIDRLLAVEIWLAQQLRNEGDVDLVVMEGYANGAKFGREMAGELGWAVKRTIREVLFVDPLIVPPTSLKKFVTGKGVAKKQIMLAHVFRQWGEMYSDDNQADAFALEKFGLSYLGVKGKNLQLKYQVEAVEAVRKGK